MQCGSGKFGGELSVIIEGLPIVFDEPPQTVDDRTMVPMRKIFEALGASVVWEPEQQLIISSKGNKLISMQIGSKNIIIHDVITNQSSVYETDAAPFISGERTLVPVRAVSECMDCTVLWEEETYTVIITAK